MSFVAVVSLTVAVGGGFGVMKLETKGLPRPSLSVVRRRHRR